MTYLVWGEERENYSLTSRVLALRTGWRWCFSLSESGNKARFGVWRVGGEGIG